MTEYIERESIKKSINSLLDMVLKFTHSPIEIKQLVFDVIDEERAADVQPVGKWISVKDKLPEKNVKVLIHTGYNATAYGFFTGAYYNNRPLFAITMNRDSKHSWYEENRVSHWMPLPEPPKDGDTE